MRSDVDFTQGRILVQRQLLTGGEAPIFIPTKGKRARVVDIAPETVDLLRTHKAHQASVKLQHCPHYHDHGLVFAKEWRVDGRRHDVLGLPLGINNIEDREFATLIAAAEVPRISARAPPHMCQSTVGGQRALEGRAGTSRASQDRNPVEHLPARGPRTATRSSATPRLLPAPFLSVQDWATVGRQKSAASQKPSIFRGRF